MKNLNTLIALAIIASIGMTSCATIFTGTHDTISFKTTPPGVTVSKDGVDLCKTPCSTKIKRSLNDVDIELKLDGYDTKQITLDKEFNVVSIINLGNLLAWGVDALSGAVMKFDKKSYDIELTKNGKTSMLMQSNLYDSVTIVPIKPTDLAAIKSGNNQTDKKETTDKKQ